MILDIPISAIIRLCDKLSFLSEDEISLVVSILVDLGLFVHRRSDGGFDVETLVNYAKRQVVAELLKCKGVMKR